MIIIADSDLAWSKVTKNFFTENNLVCDTVTNGKDCQLLIYKKLYNVLVLDIDTEDHPGLMVLKYMRLNYPSIKVILTFKDKKRFAEFGFKPEELRKLGASDILIKPFTMEKLFKIVEGENHFESWKQVADAGSVKEEEEVKAKDDEFTRIKIEAFYSGNTTIFDHYLRLGPNNFVKILHKGDSFDESRLEKYSHTQKIEFLYFKTKDRAVYVNYINQILEKSIASSKMNTAQIVTTMKSVTEKYIEEMYTVGLRPQLLEEGRKICQNMYNVIQKDSDLSKIMRQYEDYDPPSYTHLFLVSLFSTMIIKNLEWSTSRTSEMIAMGGLLHDIGKLKLPFDLKDKRVEVMSTDQLNIYRQHPLWGAQMLQKYPLVAQPVIQIVFQHHEHVNGAGYPNGLTGSKIYPLAKIVSLADDFSNLLIEKRITPLEGLKEFIVDKEKTIKHDPLAIKSLVIAFLKDKE